MSLHSPYSLQPSRNSTQPAVGIQVLPNEILLTIFNYVAWTDPNTLTQIAQVCRHWRSITAVFEPHLWRTALLCTFPLADFVVDHASLPRGSGYILGSGCEASSNWKHKFRIHYAWAEREAQNYVVGPCRPETISSALRLHPMAESGQEQHQHHHHSHHHNHHNHHNLPQVGQDDICAPSRSTSSSVRLGSVYAHSSANSSRLSFPPSISLGSDDTLSCSLCTYSDLCVIPHTGGICVRTHRHANGPRMQVLDKTMQHCVSVEDVHGHQDLVSGMAVNDAGSILVSSSIDATVRVWLVQEAFRSRRGSPTVKGVREMSFMAKVHRFGCPIQNGHVLQGHVGWVNGNRLPTWLSLFWHPKNKSNLIT